MAIRNSEEILNLIRERVGEDTSDETLSLIEDITDTLNDYETRTKDVTDWKNRYEENDREWRQRYRDRFFGTETDGDNEDNFDVGSDNSEGEILSFEDLFVEVK